MALLVLLLALAFAAGPWLVPGFGGFDPARFPVPQVAPPVQPAGYAFAIWGPIYLWLLVAMLFGWWRRADAEDWAAMRPPLALSLGVGAVWLLVARASPVWATVLIWVMLLGALAALMRAPQRDAFAAALPIGLYAGWLSAASCVAVGLLLAGYGILSETAAAFLMIAVATALAVTVQVQLNRAPTYGLAAIWALVAVAVRSDFDLGGPAAAALAGVLVLAWPTLRAARSAA